MAYLTDWQKPKNPECSCKKCKSKNVEYRIWETFDDCHQDYELRCLDCKAIWWIDGPDY